MAEDDIEVHINQDYLHADLGLTNIKIQEKLKLLANFRENNEDGQPRKEHLAELIDSLCTYYDYSKELAKYLSKIFPPAELNEFMQASDIPRPMTIRTNTLKCKRRELAQALIQRGVNLDPIGDWSKVGLKILESQVPIGATPEYLAGHYMIQQASSFLPVMALAPKQNEKVLDLCASPGGKTTHIAQLLRNTGVIVANELNKARLPALKGNVQRMGVTNCIITNYDGRTIQKVINNFDRVLLDAPCSGLGVIAKDPGIKTNRTVKDIMQNSHLQKELILAAIDAVNANSSTGGYIVYSTCSISVEENEEVVQYALKNRNVKIVETGLPIGEAAFPKFQGKQFDAKMNRCRRIYPHTYNMEGFFVAKLKKFSNDLPEGASKPHSGAKRPKLKKVKKAEEEEQPQEPVEPTVPEEPEEPVKRKRGKKHKEKPFPTKPLKKSASRALERELLPKKRKRSKDASKNTKKRQKVLDNQLLQSPSS